MIIRVKILLAWVKITRSQVMGWGSNDRGGENIFVLLSYRDNGIMSMIEIFPTRVKFRHRDCSIITRVNE